MKGLRLLTCAAAMLAFVMSAHGQALRQPELLARHYQLIAEFDRPGFAAFESDYLAAVGPNGDRCLFGCNSGYPGNAPDVAGEGYREYLAHADLVTLARMLYFSSNALDHLERSTSLLQGHWESYLAEESRAATGNGSGADFYRRAWKDYEGCIARITPPVLLASELRSEVEQLKYRGSLSAEDRQRLAAIDKVLRKITAEDE